MTKIVILTFDDGYKDTWLNVRRILEERHIRATFGIVTDFINTHFLEYTTPTFPCVSYSDIESMRNAGHEIASHTTRHRVLTELNDDTLFDDLKLSRDILSAKTLLYPGGVWDKRVARFVSALYLGARGINAGFYRGKDQRWATPCYLFTRHTTLEHANKLYDNIPDGEVLIEGYHLISDTEKKYNWSTTVQWFDNHIKYLAEQGARIMTFEEMFRCV